MSYIDYQSGEIVVSNSLTPIEFIAAVEKHGNEALELTKKYQDCQNRSRFIVTRLGLDSLQLSTTLSRIDTGSLLLLFLPFFLVC